MGGGRWTRSLTYLREMHDDRYAQALLNDLRDGDLAGVSLVAQVEREGPG